MASRFKMTAMELASLSVLTLAVAAIVIILSLKGCSGEGLPSEAVAASDSIANIVESKLASPDSLSVTTKSKSKKTKKSRKKKVKAARKQPKERNYLDEPVNE